MGQNRECKFQIGIQRGNSNGRLYRICEITMKATYKCVQTVIPRPMLRPFKREYCGHNKNVD